jgi:hypothetical protein
MTATMNTTKAVESAKVSISFVITGGTKEDGTPFLHYLGDGKMGGISNVFAPTPAPTVLPAVKVEPPKVEAPTNVKPVEAPTSERDVLIAEYKKLFGTAKGMGKASNDTLKAKIAAKKGEPVPAPTPKAEVVTAPLPPNATKVEAPKSDKPAAKKGGGGKSPMAQEIVNVTGLHTATYKCNPKEGKPQGYLTVYLVSLNNGKYRVFNPAKEQPEGLAKGYMVGSCWTAAADRIS